MLGLLNINKNTNLYKWGGTQKAQLKGSKKYVDKC